MCKILHGLGWERRVNRLNILPCGDRPSAIFLSSLVNGLNLKRADHDTTVAKFMDLETCLFSRMVVLRTEIYHQSLLGYHRANFVALGRTV